MGKKDKSKKKGKGAEKTLTKTEKKLMSKSKRELEAIGEKDIESILAEIEKEEKQRSKVTEAVVPPPSRRVNFTFINHPIKEELILFGGEFFNGEKCFVYNDLFFYNINNSNWTVLKVRGSPPPRCGHQMVSTSANKGQLWVFGGEFTSESQSQFYHYKDLWVFHLATKQWDKVEVAGSPSARSGHRMIYHNKMLFVFGGYHDNLRVHKYFNDLYCFNTETYTWNLIQPSGLAPNPRSGFCFVPLPDGKLLIHGGYYKERVKKDVDVGHVCTDTYILTPEKSDSSGLKWKWIHTKIGGIHMSPRCSMPIAVAPNGLAYCFGGVFDVEEEEEKLTGNFYNDLFCLDTNSAKLSWRLIVPLEKKDNKDRRRRRKKEDGDEEMSTEEEEEEEELEEAMKTTTIADDGIFKVSIGPTTSSTSSAIVGDGRENNVFVPSPRMNCGITIKHGILYLYGGMYEKGSKTLTLCDFYSLDLKKLDSWKVIASDDQNQEWLGSDSENDEDDDDEEEEESDEDDDAEDAMETDD